MDLRDEDDRLELPVFTTPRLRLRPLSADHLDPIVAGLSDFEVTRWLSMPPYPYGRADADDFVALCRAREERAWAVEAEDGFAGVMGLGDELGYWLRRGAWGRGYATEAGRALVDYHFETSDEDALMSGYFLGNAGSARVLEKLGFEPAHEAPLFARPLDRMVRSQKVRLTRADWQRLRAAEQSRNANP